MFADTLFFMVLLFPHVLIPVVLYKLWGASSNVLWISGIGNGTALAISVAFGDTLRAGVWTFGYALMFFAIAGCYVGKVMFISKEDSTYKKAAIIVSIALFIFIVFSGAGKNMFPQ